MTLARYAVSGMPLAVLLLGLLAPSAVPDDGKPEKLKKVSKQQGSCQMVRLPDGILLHARPYAMDRGALFFSADVFSITVYKGERRIEPVSKEVVTETLHGGFRGGMAARGMKAVFPAEALSAESEVVVAYTGAGFVGTTANDGETRFRFDPKSLR
jgi:hypothetical protein